MGFHQKPPGVLVVKHTFLEVVDRNIGVPRARFLTDSALEVADSAAWPNALPSDTHSPMVEPEASESRLIDFVPALPSKPRLLKESNMPPAPGENSPVGLAASHQVCKSPTLAPTYRSPSMTPVLAPLQENPALEVGGQPLSQCEANACMQAADRFWLPMCFMLPPGDVQTRASVTPDATLRGNQWQGMQASQFQYVRGDQLLHMDEEHASEELQRPALQLQPRYELQQHMRQQQQEQQQTLEQVAELHLDKLLHGAFRRNSPAGQDDEGSGGIRTTVMLRNLPNCYTRSKLLELLNLEGFAGRYDFVYLPIDFSSSVSLGYAFIDLISPEDADHFVQHFNGFSRWDSASEKICTVNWSNPHQGLQQHIDRYRNSPVMHSAVPDEWKPIIIIDGARVAFPAPTKIIKAPKLRKRPGEISATTASVGSSYL